MFSYASKNRCIYVNLLPFMQEGKGNSGADTGDKLIPVGRLVSGQAKWATFQSPVMSKFV